MKKPISDLSPEEALDQSVLYTLDRKLQAARNAQKIADQRLQAVFDVLENMCIDADSIPWLTENISLDQAISRYILNGDYTRSAIMRAVRKAYGEEGGSQ